jgi:hypothetical protein
MPACAIASNIGVVPPVMSGWPDSGVVFDAEDADRAGDRAGFGKDHVGRRRHPVTAARCQTAHRHDHGQLLSLGLEDREPDLLGRQHRSTRRIDAHDQRLQRLLGEPVEHRLLDRLARRLAGAAFAVDDLAGDRQHSGFAFTQVS